MEGGKFAEILIAEGLHIEQHRDHFENGTADTIWIPEVAKAGMITVTGDENTRYKPQEIKMIVISKARVLHVVNGKNATHPMLAKNFAQTKEKIESFSRKEWCSFFSKNNKT